MTGLQTSVNTTHFGKGFVFSTQSSKLCGYLDNPFDPLDPRPSTLDPRPSTSIFVFYFL